MKDNKTSLHINGFWHHITWESEEVGYDQRGTKWMDKQSPKCSNKTIIVLEEMYSDLGKLMLKKYSNYF